jgi:anti-anti-sigma factor
VRQPAPAPGARVKVKYELSGGVLRISGPIGYDLHPEFAPRCRELLQCPEQEILLDLSGVAYLSSTYLGVLAPLYLKATDAGKVLTIRVQNKVGRVFRLAGFDRLGKFETVD